MKKKIATLLLPLLVAGITMLFPSVSVVHATLASNLAMPDVSVCQNVGTTFTAALTASNITTVTSWQANITFSNLRVVNQVLGSSWTGSSYFSVNATNSGSTLYGFTFLSGATFTSVTPVTMLTITFKVMSRPSVSIFHIVLISENVFGTKLLNTNLSTQTYTTSDGTYANCVDGPEGAGAPSLPSLGPSTNTSKSSLTREYCLFHYAECSRNTLPTGEWHYDSQVLPTNNYLADLILPTGDKVSWGFEAAGLVYPDGTSRSWGTSNFGTGVKVAVLNGGVNGTQLPDLQGQVEDYFNFYSASEDQWDHAGHGTAMASIIASKHDGAGMSGIAYNAKIYSAKVFNRLGQSSDAAVIAGITWAVSKGVNIISMSFGRSGTCPSNIQSAVNSARANGITLVAAAGNNPPGGSLQAYDSVEVPANCDGVLAISSYGLAPFNQANGFTVECGSFGPSCPGGVVKGLFSEFSLEGPKVVFAAPGKSVLAWYPNPLTHVLELSNAYSSGTSQATAFASGLLALGHDRYGTLFNPYSRLWQMASPVFNGQQDSFFGYGLFNATKMLTQNVSYGDRGDVNGDGAVDVVDATVIGGAFGSIPSLSTWRPAADLNWDGVINIVDLVSWAGKFGVRYLAPPEKNVWGANANDYPLVDLAQQPGPLLAIMGECSLGCSGDTVTLSGTVSSLIDSYVTLTTTLSAYYIVNGGPLGNPIVTKQASQAGDSFTTTFSVPANSFWQIVWGINGAQLSAFGVRVFATFSLSNAIATQTWGVLIYSA